MSPGFTCPAKGTTFSVVTPFESSVITLSTKASAAGFSLSMRLFQRIDPETSSTSEISTLEIFSSAVARAAAVSVSMPLIRRKNVLMSVLPDAVTVL